MKLLIIQFSLTSCHFIIVWSKYSPQHPVLKHAESISLRKCQRLSSTPMRNHRQNYGFVYSNFTFLECMREDKKFLHGTAASVIWAQTPLNFLLEKLICYCYLNCATFSKGL
jgi:hypothetical protein